MKRAALVLMLCACTAPEEGGSSTRIPSEVAAVDGAIPGLYITATLYVRRGECAKPGSESDDGDTFVDVEHLHPGQREVDFQVAIPFMQLARPLGPLQRWCSRVVYTASLLEDAPDVGGPWPRTWFDNVRLAHQDGAEDLVIRPFSDNPIDSWGPLHGADPSADLALYDDDGDGLPNLREVQLALRPRDIDSLEPDPRFAPVELPAVTGVEFGSEDGISTEKPMVRRDVPAFAIDVMEATNHQYRVCMATPHGSEWACPAPLVATEDVLDPSREAYPVVGVSQAQARAFCQARGMDLPTEKQWERAARVSGSSTTEARRYPWGDSEPMRALDQTNDCTTYGRFVLYTDTNIPLHCADHPGSAVLGPILRDDGSAVRTAQVNGLIDLAGSVAEWTRDPWQSAVHDWINTNGDTPVGTQPGEGFATRGGSFRSGQRFVRSYARSPVDDSDSTTRDEVLRAVGLRCAR